MSSARSRSRGKSSMSPSDGHEEQADKSSPRVTSTSPTVKRKKSGAPKPSVTVIEINSGEESESAQIVSRGAARGLNPNNVLSMSTQETTELVKDDNDDDDDDDDDEGNHDAKPKPALPTHGTRGSRYGRAPVDYDMKYHPMDEVTRPNSRRTTARRSGSRSVTASFKRNRGGDTTSESEVSMPKSSEDEDSEDEEDQGSPPTLERRPDPKASRHSARSEAQKMVNYSRKYHPQDYGLPGFQHKARQLATPASLPRKKRKRLHRSSQAAAEGDTRDDDTAELPGMDETETEAFMDGMAAVSPRASSQKVVDDSDDAPEDRADTQEDVPNLLDVATQALAQSSESAGLVSIEASSATHFSDPAQPAMSNVATELRTNVASSVLAACWAGTQ